MKSKTNISTRNNTGIKITSDMIIGKTSNKYKSGDILDANATVEMVKKMIHDETILFNSITTLDIENNTIKMEDLSKEVTDKLEPLLTITNNDIDDIAD